MDEAKEGSREIIPFGEDVSDPTWDDACEACKKKTPCSNDISKSREENNGT